MWSQIRKNKMLSIKSINGHIYSIWWVLLNRKRIAAYFLIFAMKTFTTQPLETCRIIINNFFTRPEKEMSCWLRDPLMSSYFTETWERTTTSQIIQTDTCKEMQQNHNLCIHSKCNKAYLHFLKMLLNCINNLQHFYDSCTVFWQGIWNYSVFILDRFVY